MPSGVDSQMNPSLSCCTLLMVLQDRPSFADRRVTLKLRSWACTSIATISRLTVTIYNKV